MNIHDCEQRSDEWFALRCGRITGTRIKDMAGGRDATVETLCMHVAAEIITGTPEGSIRVTDAMQHGIDTEDEAREAYCWHTGSVVETPGFVSLDDLFGCSPDGLVDPDGGVEIKCPQPHTHLGYLLDDKAWRDYRWQLQGSLWVTGRKWWDFVSYCPSFDLEHRLIVQRVKPVKADQEKIAERAAICRLRVREIVEAYRGQA